MSNTPLAWLAGFGGAYLLYAAVWDRHPVADLQGTLTGKGAAPAKSLGSGSSGGGGTGTGATPTPATATAPASTAGGGRKRANVPKSATAPVSTRLGKYGATIYLRPDTLRAFHAWQAAFGSVIPCTGGWRSEQDANRNHAAQPKRFADAANSWHCAGDAVDVNYDWLATLSAAQQSKLRITAKANGWLQGRWKGEASCGSNPDNDDEAGHFSYGGCG